MAQMLRRSAFGAHEGVYKVALLSIVKTALSGGDDEVLGELLKEEPDIVLREYLPDMEGDTALHYASSLPFNQATTLLLQQPTSDPNVTGSLGRRPLHFAASSGNAAMIQLLLNASADINAASDDGSTALLLACAKGHADVADVLVLNSCHADIFDSSGLAAIHHAARECHVGCVTALVASVNTLDSRRDPPLYVCCEICSCQVTRSLICSPHAQLPRSYIVVLF
jgi:ankyrin repeat protein